MIESFVTTLQRAVRAWSWFTRNAALGKQDASSLGIGSDEAGVYPGTLQNVLDLDADRLDTKFQSGVAYTCMTSCL